MTPDQESRLRDLARSRVVGGDIKAALAEIDRLRDALKVTREFVDDELASRLYSFCGDGPNGEPDISTLNEDEDGGACREAMKCLARIDAALEASDADPA